MSVFIFMETCQDKMLNDANGLKSNLVTKTDRIFGNVAFAMGLRQYIYKGTRTWEDELN
jgi:hypothetical protein